MRRRSCPVGLWRMQLLSEIITQALACGLMAYVAMVAGLVAMGFLLGWLFNRNKGPCNRD